jgi:hypothetical protein
MPRPLRHAVTLALIAALAWMSLDPASAATRSSRRRAKRTASSAPARPRVPTWVAPYKAITSGDGVFTACNYNMKQEGWGAMMLFQQGRLIRVAAGVRAVAWEPGTTRLLVTEAVPDDELHWFIIDPARGGDDVDMRELPRTRVSAGRDRTFRTWLADGRIVFGRGIDATARDTVAVPAAGS